jgi:hypothetical protein
VSIGESDGGGSITVDVICLVWQKEKERKRKGKPDILYCGILVGRE